MSLTTFRDVPISVCRFSTVAVGRMSGKLLFNCVVRKLTVDQKWDSVWSTFCFFLARKLNVERVQISSNLDNREAGNWSGCLVGLSMRRDGSISSLYGAKPTWKQEKLGLQPKKKRSHITNGLLAYASLRKSDCPYQTHLNRTPWRSTPSPSTCSYRRTSE